MRFVDDTHGFLGGDGAIWATSDAGARWRRVWRGDGTVVVVDASDRTHVWATVRTSPGAELLLTTDGGVNWRRIATQSELGEISMVNTTVGWAVGGPTPMDTQTEPFAVRPAPILRTTDGGRTWVDTGERAESVCAASPAAAWGAAGTTVLRTVDAGASWSARTLYSPRWYSVGHIGCSSASVAWDLAWGGGSMSQTPYLASRTSDAGNTWTPLLHEAEFPLPPGVSRVHAEIDANPGPLEVESAAIALFAGSCGACQSVSVTRTVDGGASFTHVHFKEHRRVGEAVPLSMSFPDANHGWLLVGVSGLKAAQLWRTTDGGASWTRLTLRLCFPRPCTGTAQG
jgi:photosystem II stability/assembly factor-like uncharacterized protein